MMWSNETQAVKNRREINPLLARIYRNPVLFLAWRGGENGSTHRPFTPGFAGSSPVHVIFIHPVGVHVPRTASLPPKQTVVGSIPTPPVKLVRIRLGTFVIKQR